MKVVLGPLAKSGLEGSVGPDLPAAINAALVYYVANLDSGKRPPRFPDFASVQGNREGGGESSPNDDLDRSEFEVEVDEQVAATLAAEAESQGVGVSDLAGHAVLVYLAELDLIGDPDGRIPARGPVFVIPAGNGDDLPSH